MINHDAPMKPTMKIVLTCLKLQTALRYETIPNINLLSWELKRPTRISKDSGYA